MGIQGLLSFLKHKECDKSAINPMHIRDFSGKVAAIDGYCWLHKAAFGCAYDLFNKVPTTKYVDYCIKLLQMLKHYKIKPILVFDGAKVPIKIVNETRREIRQNAKKQALTLIAAGKANEAFNFIVGAIDITHEMVHNLIKAAREIRVDSIVAPFEADAQLAYLEKSGIIDFVITEDSDLIVYGCKKIFFKMDKNGYGEYYDGNKLELVMRTKSVKFSVFNFTKFRRAAILSGCDYVKNLSGIGLVKAWKFMNLTDNDDIRQFLKKIPHYMNMKIIVDDEYVENFILAEYAFLYQTVFDPRSKQRVPMNQIEVGDEDYKKFSDKFKSTSLDTFQLALGNIDSNNKFYDDYTPNENSYTVFSQKSPKKERPPPPKTAFTFITINKGNSNLNNTDVKHEDEENEINGESLMSYYSTNVIKKAETEEVQEPPKKKVRSCKFVRDVAKQTYKSKYFTTSKQDELIKLEDGHEEQEKNKENVCNNEQNPATPNESIEITLDNSNEGPNEDHEPDIINKMDDGSPILYSVDDCSNDSDCIMFAEDDRYQSQEIKKKEESTYESGARKKFVRRIQFVQKLKRRASVREPPEPQNTILNYFKKV